MRSFRGRERSALAVRGRDVPPLGAGTRRGRGAARWSGGGARAGLSQRGVKVSTAGRNGTLSVCAPATAAFGEPVGLGSACPVTCEDSLGLQKRLWDVVGARESSAALALVGAPCSLGCLRRGARKELQTRKEEKHGQP